MLSRKPERPTLETQLLQAHLKRQQASKSGDESVTTIVARHGPYEVRLYESPNGFLPGGFLFWIELFDHDEGISLDSCGSHILEDAVMAAQHFIARAKHLSTQFGRT
jgi:hypothetical protein